MSSPTGGPDRRETPPNLSQPVPRRASSNFPYPIPEGDATQQDAPSFATAQSHQVGNSTGRNFDAAVSDGVETVRPHSDGGPPTATFYTPPSPSPRRDVSASMATMDQTSIVGGQLPRGSEVHSTPNPEYAQRWGAPRPAPANVLQAVSPRVSPRIASLSSRSRDAIGTYEAALTSYQTSLREQVSLRSQQLAAHADELKLLHGRSDAVLREYANEVRAAQARTNRALTDNQQMLQDIDRTIAESRHSMGLAPLAEVGPVPHQHIMTAHPVSRSAPPTGSVVVHPQPDTTTRAHTSPPMASVLSVGSSAHETRYSNQSVPRMPDEPLED